MSLGLTAGNTAAPINMRGDDLYETPEVAVHALLRCENFNGLIWEPACGPGRIVKVLRDSLFGVVASDLIDYGCPMSVGRVDFLLETAAPPGVKAIVTNPPFKLGGAFALHALALGVPKICMLLRLAFLESDGRSDILDGGALARVHVFRNRLPMMHRYGYEGPRIKSGAMAYAWFVWERDHEGPTILDRISWDV